MAAVRTHLQVKSFYGTDGGEITDKLAHESAELPDQHIIYVIPVMRRGVLELQVLRLLRQGGLLRAVLLLGIARPELPTAYQVTWPEPTGDRDFDRQNLTSGIGTGGC